MEVQKLNHKILSTIGQCLRSDASPLKQFISAIISVTIVLFLCTFMIWPSLAYMYMHANNFQNCLSAGYQVAAFVSCTGIYITFSMQKSFVHDVYTECSRIATQRKRCTNDLRYERAERKCFYGAFSIILILSISFLGNTMIATTQNIISGLLNGRLEPSKWYTPYTMT